MKFLPKLYSSIPLIIIGGLIIKLNFNGGEDNCGGFPEALGSFFLFILFTICLGLILFISSKRTTSHIRKFNFVPLFTTTVLTILFIIAVEWNSMFTYKIVLFAEDNYRARLSISLHEKNSFEVFVGQVEHGCFHRGKFILHDDTLIFERNVLSLTDSLVANKYFVDHSKGLLYPIELGKISSDTTKYFKIIKE